MHRIRPLFLLSALLVGACPSPGWAASYTFATFDAPVSGEFQTLPTDINNKGEIAGLYYYLATGLTPHGFLLSGGDFSSFDSPTGFTDFWGLNDRGQIVGYDGHAGFVLTDGHFDGISVPGSSYTSASKINDLGQIVGDALVSNTPTGYLLSDGTFSFISGRAIGINDLSQVVGSVETHGFLLSSGMLSLIDVPGASNTTPTDINNRGDIVGDYAVEVVLHGFILNSLGLSTIDVPGSSFTQVTGINDRGQIVGIYGGTDRPHGFVATPIPEPATWLLLAAGLGGLMRRLSRSQ